MNEIVSTLASNGYVLIEDFLDAGEESMLFRGCGELVAMHGERQPVDAEFRRRHKSNCHTFVNKEHCSRSLRRFCDLPKVRNLAEAVFDGRCLPHMSLLQHGVAGGGQGQAWHRDVLLVFGPMQLVNFLFYPLGTSPEQGGLRAVPGSQAMTDVDIDGPFGPAAGEQTIYPGSRDLLLVDGACFHAVNGNESTRDRIAFNLRFRHADAPLEITRHGVFTTGTVDYLPDAGAEA